MLQSMIFPLVGWNEQWKIATDPNVRTERMKQTGYLLMSSGSRTSDPDDTLDIIGKINRRSSRGMTRECEATMSPARRGIVGKGVDKSRRQIRRRALKLGMPNWGNLNSRKVFLFLFLFLCKSMSNVHYTTLEVQKEGKNRVACGDSLLCGSRITSLDRTEEDIDYPSRYFITSLNSTLVGPS